jgi:hypothetical protein
MNFFCSFGVVLLLSVVVAGGFYTPSAGFSAERGGTFDFCFFGADEVEIRHPIIKILLNIAHCRK